MSSAVPPPGFAELVQSRSPALLRTAVLLTGDPGRAEDLLQTALARTWERWDRLRAPEAAEAYVRRVMATTSAKWWQRRWVAEVPTAELPSGAAADAAESVEQRVALARALATLTPRQRTVLVLRYFDDLSERAVADALGCSVGTVKSTSSRALAALRDLDLLDDVITRPFGAGARRPDLGDPAMTDHDRLRRALADLAGAAPGAPDRLAGVARRVGVRRRARIAGAGLLAAVTVLSAGVAVGAPRAPGRDVVHVTAGDETERHSAEPSASPRRSARPSSRPSASASQRPRRSARPSPTHSRPSRTASPRARSPRPTPSNGASPLRIAVRVNPAQPRTGEQVTVQVTVRDGSGALLGVHADFGDGTKAAPRFTATCPSGEGPHGTQRTVELTHRYERPGTYSIAVSVRTGECGASPERRSVRGRAHVLAAPGEETPSNGGALPVAQLGQMRGSDGSSPRTVGVRVGGADSDGYVSRLVVDWGDGSEPTVVTFPLSECRTGDTGYPSSRRRTSLRHTYAQDGQYAVRLQVVTVGCGGGDEQTAQTRARVTVPAPTRSPAPSPSARPSPAG